MMTVPSSGAAPSARGVHRRGLAAGAAAGALKSSVGLGSASGAPSMAGTDIAGGSLALEPVAVPMLVEHRFPGEVLQLGPLQRAPLANPDEEVRGVVDEELFRLRVEFAARGGIGRPLRLGTEAVDLLVAVPAVVGRRAGLHHAVVELGRIGQAHPPAARPDRIHPAQLSPILVLVSRILLQGYRDAYRSQILLKQLLALPLVFAPDRDRDRQITDAGL